MNRLRKAISYSIKCSRILGLQTIPYFISWMMHGTFHLTVQGTRVSMRGRTSDQKCFYQVFVQNQYPLVQIPAGSLILDIGANAGYFAILARARYPESHIICVEPDAENYALALSNTRDLGSISCIRAAIGSSKGKALLLNPNAEHWAKSFARHEGQLGDQAVEVLTIDDLLAKSGQSRIGLIKIDIEGNEAELFSNNISWLDRVDILMVEIHKNCWKTTFGALSRHEYSSDLSGDNLIIGFRPK